VSNVKANAALLEPFRGQDERVDARLKMVDRQRAIDALFASRPRGKPPTSAEFDAVVKPFDTPPTIAPPAPEPPVLSEPIAMGSYAPELVQPVNQKAIAIQAAATGIRKQLVSERADP
jgi:hypothetical protein